jgi:hypothetical protein
VGGRKITKSREQRKKSREQRAKEGTKIKSGEERAMSGSGGQKTLPLARCEVA